MLEGYEGIMVRNQKASYKIDKRSYDLLKYKTFEDDEFEIIGFKFVKRRSQKLKSFLNCKILNKITGTKKKLKMN